MNFYTDYDLRFECSTEDKIEEATHLYTQSFLAMNTMWKQMGATYKDVYSVTRGKLIAACKAGWLCVNIYSFSLWSMQKRIS